MPPIPSTAAADQTPRLVLYQQTHHTPAGEPISILPLVTRSTGITHLYIAAFHLNDGPGNITLNDHPPQNERYNQLWGEVRWLQGAGVKVMAMLGGAAQGTFARLNSGDDVTFEAYYKPLADILRQHRFQGVDLDIEEPMRLPCLERLILRLKADFGDSFIITLAPVAAAMLPVRPYLISLVRRYLTTPPSEWENLPLIIRAFMKLGILKSLGHLSGFNHFDLETSPAGKLVSWYNVQCYNGWGDAGHPGLYMALVECGWRPERIVLGVLTNPTNGPSGHVECERLKQVIAELRSMYPGQFGGLMGWEYFNAGQERGGGKVNWQWVKEMGEVLGLSTPQAQSPQSASVPRISGPLQQLTMGESAPGEAATQATTTSAHQFPEEHVAKLVELGFERSEAIMALEAMNGDVDQAAMLLFGEGGT